MMSRGGRLNLPVVIWFVSFLASSDFSSCASRIVMCFQCACIVGGLSLLILRKNFSIAATRVVAIGWCFVVLGVFGGISMFGVNRGPIFVS